jgi:hypothetical protein
MGKTIVKHEDVEALYDKLKEYERWLCVDGSTTPNHDKFIEMVGDIFGITLPNEITDAEIEEICKQSDIPDQSLGEMLSTVTDENRQELVDFGKPVGKEQI